MASSDNNSAFNSTSTPDNSLSGEVKSTPLKAHRMQMRKRRFDQSILAAGVALKQRWDDLLEIPNAATRKRPSSLQAPYSKPRKAHSKIKKTVKTKRQTKMPPRCVPENQQRYALAREMLLRDMELFGHEIVGKKMIEKL